MKLYDEIYEGIKYKSKNLLTTFVINQDQLKRRSKFKVMIAQNWKKS